MPYSESFFSSHQAGSTSSASRLAPFILELSDARSIVDVGCGIGTWLAEFQKLGISDFAGVDGTWVKPEQLLIPREQFVAADLARELPVQRTFDVAISMEVAEHLPESGGDRFVQSLTTLAPIIVFSAAIPMQGGTDHINEQWPQHWAAKFSRHGYSSIDCIRPHVWNDRGIEWWYAQNAIVYASAAALAKSERLRTMHEQFGGEPLPLVHPGCLTARVTQPLGLRRLLRELPPTLIGAVRARVGRGVSTNELIA